MIDLPGEPRGGLPGSICVREEAFLFWRPSTSTFWISVQCPTSRASMRPACHKMASIDVEVCGEVLRDGDRSALMVDQMWQSSPRFDA